MGHDGDGWRDGSHGVAIVHIYGPLLVCARELMLMPQGSSQPPGDEGLLLSPFIDEGTEAQKGEVARSESQAGESGFRPCWLEFRGHTR